MNAGTDTWNRPITRTTFEITDGPYAGRRLRADLHGTAQRLVKGAAPKARFQLSVFQQKSESGRTFSVVDVPTIRLEPTGAAAGAIAAPTAVPSAEEILQASDQFDVGFVCVDTVNTQRRQVNWREAFHAMAACEAPELLGRAVFGSAYAFNHELAEHEAANARSGKQGSLAGYAGTVHSPLLTFDIDRNAAAGGTDVPRALEDAIRLFVVLLEHGIAPEHILLSFSGNKGFHIQVPSMLVGAIPSPSFARTAGKLCEMLAAESGIEIDRSLYRPLQPLRMHNSRNEKSGLFKIALTTEEFLELSAAEIQALAGKPRAFQPPPFVCEPIAGLVELWRRAEHVVTPNTPAHRRELPGGVDEARIFQSTWDFLVNGAIEGERATILFRAAANLSDFATVGDLVQALLERPVRLCGLPTAEAESHIQGALNRSGSLAHPENDRLRAPAPGKSAT